MHGIDVKPNVLRSWRSRHRWDDMVKGDKAGVALKKRPFRITAREKSALEAAGTPVEELRETGMLYLLRTKHYIKGAKSEYITNASEAATIGKLAVLYLEAADRYDDSKLERNAEATRTPPDEFKQASLADHMQAIQALEGRLINVTPSATAQQVVEDSLEDRFQQIIDQQ